MWQYEQLESRLAGLCGQKEDAQSRYPHHPLVNELQQRITSASSSLSSAASADGNAHFSHCMMVAFNLNRCEAIMDQLDAEQGTGPVTEVCLDRRILALARDKVFVRWLAAQLSSLRGGLLRYTCRYRSPPLSEALALISVQRLDRNGWLLRLLRKLKSRIKGGNTHPARDQ